MGLHRVVLLGCEVPALEQDVVGDRDLADVVQRRRLAQALDLFAAEPHTRRDLRGERADAFGVLGGLVIAILDRRGEQLQCLGASIVELERPLGDLFLERARAVGELALRSELGFERYRVVVLELRFQAAPAIDEPSHQHDEREHRDRKDRQDPPRRVHAHNFAPRATL